MAEKETFEYVYSAPEQDEIRKIREKYLTNKETKIDTLRGLDNSVTNRGRAVSISHGILFSLILGFGMSCCMVWSEHMFIPGIIIGCIGIVGILSAYPVYIRLVKKEREKIAPEILRLSDELMQGNQISL